MAIIAVGPEFAINGPLPARRPYTLVDSTLITEPPPAVAEDVANERWANGIAVHGYINELGSAWGVCNEEMSPGEKGSQENPTPLPTFGPITVYVTETCSSPYIRTYDDFKNRADTVFAAVESGALAREFELGEFVPGNPFLSDSNCVVLNSGLGTSLTDAVAQLEDAIAATHRGGVIHMPAAVATALTTLGGGGVLWQDGTPWRGGVLRTINGTLVIPDAGYTGDAPAGQDPNQIGEKFLWATGPVETLRTASIQQIPGAVDEALNREDNTVEYRAERYYIPFWDTALQVGIRTTWCTTECVNP